MEMTYISIYDRFRPVTNRAIIEYIKKYWPDVVEETIETDGDRYYWCESCSNARHSMGVK